DGVDLHRIESGGLRSVDALEHTAEEGTSGHGLEGLGIDGVERDVDAVETGLLECGGPFVETDRVRRQGDIWPRLQCGDYGDDLVDVLAGQRLTAGETDLIDTELLNGDAHEAHDLVTGHRGIPGHELDAFGGHAVGAAQIAEIGE